MAAYIYQLIAYKILYLTVCFVLKRSLAICHITQGHFSRCPLIWIPFPELQIFSRIFWVLPIEHKSIRKSDTWNFCLFGYFQSYNDKSKFLFF